MLNGKCFSYTSKWNFHHPLGNADQLEVYRCYQFHVSGEGNHEGGAFQYVEERLKGPLGAGLPKREDYQIEGLTEAEEEDRPFNSECLVLRKRVRKYYKKEEERKRFELQGHWQLEPTLGVIRLVYPVEASYKGTLGGPLVTEWTLVKDGNGVVTGLTYSGNDAYTLTADDKLRDW